ncbi:GNAT family N-acetyltransferase [Arenicella xantha]|uniref:Ribosomal-protein-alanine N-acetyltransferase n=1 Tax=Arenicella xantha TaxID=644221 RepID=A0A395JPS7_9GAMM|nr:GNAT family N-acetyltransferase [Arenicella xantha]RBP53609.1 ribosomal-protein-alanine N-acetyltransferase [Arenicella xantha]
MIEQLTQLKIETERLRIRRIEDADVKAIYPIHSEPVVNRYLPYDTWTSWDDAKHWYARVLERRRILEAEQFVIELKDSANIIGTCIAFSFCPNARSLEFGYVLGRAAWKQGYMLEAMSSFVPTLQQRLALNTLIARVESDNLASLALVKKLGFKHIDTMISSDGVHLCQLQKQYGSTA